MLFFHLVNLTSDSFEFSSYLVNGCLFPGKVAADNHLFRDEVTGPASVFLPAFLVPLDYASGFSLPALGGDIVAVVLHGLRPVVHQALIDVIIINKRLAGIVGKKVFRKSDDDFFRFTVFLQLP